MGRAVRDLVGQVFGDLTVVERTESVNGRAGWLCKCVCGADKVTVTEQLVSGKTKSCGCRRKKPKPIKHDLTDLRFGMLVAKHVVPKTDAAQPNRWHCQCDCGNTFDVAHGALTSGHTESCGCQRSQSLDLTGKRFGRLIALERMGANDLRKGVWKCQCDCGNLHETTTGALQSGQTKSCGCLHIETSGQNNRSHGATAKDSEVFSEYQIWNGMRQRCSNPNHSSYDYYGGRGITVCEAWENDFETFLADMGPKPFPYATLERVDNDKGYGPGNVVWATRKQQGGNSRKNRVVFAFGKKQTVTQLYESTSKAHGISYQSLMSRLNLGWNPEEAATKAVDQRKGTRRGHV